MADLGGIIKAILIIATIINNILAKNDYYIDIINSNLRNMNVSVDEKNGKLSFEENSIKSAQNRLIIGKPLEVYKNIKNNLDVKVADK